MIEEHRDDGDGEFQLMMPSGKVAIVLARSRIERDEKGHAVAIFGAVMDVTDRRRAEAAEIRSSALLSRALDCMDQGLIMVDGAMMVQVCNRRAAALFDLSEAFLATTPTYRQYRDTVRRSRMWGDLVEDTPLPSEAGPSTEFRSERRTHDGHALEIRTTPTSDGGMIQTYHDITDQRAVENRYKMLADNATDLIALKPTFAGQRSYVAPASRAIVGWEPVELALLPMDQFVHPDDYDRVAADYASLSPSHPRGTNMHRVLHKDGRYIWIDETFQLTNAGRPDEAVIIAARDITARKAADEELNAARTAAEDASRAKTDFLASMSHEIRTPLNGVIGYTDLMLDDADLTAEQRRRAERIRSSGSALLTIVDDILDFSKIEAGHIDLDPAPFELSALLDNATSIVRAAIDRKKLDLHVYIEAALPPRLLGDQNRLRQILLNLLNNALKFTAKGHVTLSVNRCRERHEGSWFRFAVADSGIGIPEEKRGRLFERFSQVDSTIRREFGGTGLGLAISKRLVELMGGMIGVDSTAGVGSLFWFEVPLPIVDQAREKVVAPMVAKPDGRGVRILLVEDVEINQEIARAVLESVGHNVDIASDGLEAVTAVQTASYDLVLMDVQMPGMDGMTATQHIRALSSPACDVPIVAMTANVLPAQIAAFRAAGMDDHIGKPFDRMALHDVIARWSNERQGSKHHDAVH